MQRYPLSTSGGSVDFASTIDGANNDLDISTGSGSVSISGTIGGVTPLSTLDINSSGAGTITLNDIGDSDTQGANWHFKNW